MGSSSAINAVLSQEAFPSRPGFGSLSSSASCTGVLFMVRARQVFEVNMETRHLPLQYCERIAGMGKIAIAPHLLQLPGSLRCAACAEVARLALKAVSCTHDPVRVSIRDRLLQFLQKFGRLFQKDVAQVPEQF